MTSSTPRPRTRFLLPAAVLCAHVLALALAASAGAQTVVGEGTSPADPTLPGEVDMTAASVTYDSTTGAVSFSITTTAAPGTSSEDTMLGELLTSPGICALSEIGANSVPAMFFRAPYALAQSEVFAGKEAETEPNPGEHKGGLSGLGYGTKTVSGTTTNLSIVDPELANRPYNCALVSTNRQKAGEEGKTQKFFVFPIAPKPVPPTVISVPTPDPPKPAPTLIGALAFPKASPLTEKRERWTTVRFKVTNPGTAAIGPVTVKAKAPKGVRLEPATLKLPALLPGQTWPAAFRMEVTEAAPPRSTIALSASAAGLFAKGSVVVKPTG
jgi:hypothetical protein